MGVGLGGLVASIFWLIGRRLRPEGKLSSRRVARRLITSPCRGCGEKGIFSASGAPTRYQPGHKGRVPTPRRQPLPPRPPPRVHRRVAGAGAAPRRLRPGGRAKAPHLPVCCGLYHASDLSATCRVIAGAPFRPVIAQATGRRGTLRSEKLRQRWVENDVSGAQATPFATNCTNIVPSQPCCELTSQHTVRCDGKKVLLAELLFRESRGFLLSPSLENC